MSILGGTKTRVLGLTLVILAIAAAPAAADPYDPADPGQTMSFTLGSGDTANPYIVYVPTSYDASRPAPLVVMTHGCQTTAEQQMRSTLWNQVAEREGIVMLYPDVNQNQVNQPGPLKRCWGFFDPGTNAHRDSGDMAALAGMTQAVLDGWSIDRERMYMVGMSAGSFMTSNMAAAYPELFAAVGIMAGGAYADGTCFGGLPGGPVEASAQAARDEMGSRARVIPRIVMGGDADQGITPDCADKALLQGLRTNNLVLGDSQTAPISLEPASVEEVPKDGGYSSTVSTYRDPDGCVIGQRWLIHGMNHFWSGGTSDTTYKNFNDPKGPNGADVMWDFLSRYTKASTEMPCAEAEVEKAARCEARWLRFSIPAGAERVRAKVNGRRAKVKVKGKQARVRLPATVRERTVVKLKGRDADGDRFKRKRTRDGCG